MPAEPTTHPPGRLRPTKARAGDRFDLVLLGASAGFLILNGSDTLDALSIQDLVGRVGALVYLGLLVTAGVGAMFARRQRTIGLLMLLCGAIGLTLASAAIFVRGLEGALLPAAFYIIAGRRLADRAWYLEADDRVSP